MRIIVRFVKPVLIEYMTPSELLEKGFQRRYYKNIYPWPPFDVSQLRIWSYYTRTIPITLDKDSYQKFKSVKPYHKAVLEQKVYYSILLTTSVKVNVQPIVDELDQAIKVLGELYNSVFSQQITKAIREVARGRMRNDCKPYTISYIYNADRELSKSECYRLINLHRGVFVGGKYIEGHPGFMRLTLKKDEDVVYVTDDGGVVSIPYSVRTGRRISRMGRFMIRREIDLAFDIAFAQRCYFNCVSERIQKLERKDVVKLQQEYYFYLLFMNPGFVRSDYTRWKGITLNVYKNLSKLLDVKARFESSLNTLYDLMVKKHFFFVKPVLSLAARLGVEPDAEIYSKLENEDFDEQYSQIRRFLMEKVMGERERGLRVERRGRRPKRILEILEYLALKHLVDLELPDKEAESLMQEKFSKVRELIESRYPRKGLTAKELSELLGIDIRSVYNLGLTELKSNEIVEGEEVEVRGEKKLRRGGSPPKTYFLNMDKPVGRYIALLAYNYVCKGKMSGFIEKYILGEDGLTTKF